MADTSGSGLRYIALLDTETTSLEPPPVGKTIEVAVALFDLKHAQVVASFASLIRGDTNEAFSINHIPPTMLPDAHDPDLVWRAVKWIIGPAQIIVCHNAEFDRQFCPDLGKPFVCSENDIAWPGRARAGSLVSLALSLGLGIAHAHRAMSDVDTLSRVLTRLAEMGHDLEAILKHAMRPKAMFHALAPYEERETVKQAGFRWNPEKKVWWRLMPVEDAAKLPFKVRGVG